MAARFSVEAVFKAVDRVTAPVTRMQNRIGKFSRNVERRLGRLDRGVSKVTSGVRRSAVVIAAALALPAAAMGSLISTGADFQQTMVSAAARFPGMIRQGTEAFRELEAAAQKTGATTEFTATQTAQALNFLAMAGFSAESAIAALPGVVDLATAAELDLAQATDVASDSLGAFNLATEDSVQLGANLARVNDVIARTATSANTRVDALFEAIKDGGPVATTAGASLETFAALAGKLADAGIKGTRAGTTLKNMFLSLSAPGKQAAEILSRLGIQTQTASGDMLDIVDILDALDKSLASLGTAQRSAVLEGIFGKIPIAGVNVLLGVGSERLREFRAELENASGASTAMADVMRDTLRGRLNSLNSAIEGVKISVFALVQGPLSDAVERTTEWVRANEGLIATRIGDFFTGIVDNFSDIVEWGKRIGIAVAVFFSLVAVLKTLILVMTAVNLVLLANPITLIVLAIMALIAAVAAAVIWWDELKEAFAGLAPEVKTALAALSGPVGWLLAVPKMIMENWEPIKQFFVDLWTSVVKVFDIAIAKIASITGGIGDSVSAALERVAGIGSGIADFFGFGDSEEDSQAAGAGTPQVASPQERVARSIEERSTTTAAEVTIKDESGRAEVTDGKLGAGLSLQASGAF